MVDLPTRDHPDWPDVRPLVSPQAIPQGHNRPLLPEEIAAGIRELLAVLESNTEDLHDRSVSAAIAERDYRVRKAQALLRSGQKTGPQREADAIIQSQDELLNRNISVALRDAAQDAIRTRRSELEALRTLAASARTVETGRG
jgi:hypothetical protein